MERRGRFGGWQLAVSTIVLACLTVVLAMTYSSVARQSALDAARVEAERRAALEVGTLAAEIGKYRVLPFVLVELPDMEAALARGVPEARRRLNGTLAALARQTGATVLYAVDRGGMARSASNAGSADSFVGYDFRFRPYFVDALRTGGSEYFARGSVTGRPGLFLARRAGGPEPAGVIVVKIEFDRIERLWRAAGRLSLVVDRDGVIVMGTDPRLRFRTIGQMPPARRAAIARSQQYGPAPLADAGWRLDGQGYATGSDGRRYLVVSRGLPVLGWRYLHIEPVQPALDAANARVRFGLLVVALLLATMFVLGWWSVTRRRRAEAAHAALEAEVSRRTAELTHAYDRLQRETDERARADSRYRAAREELAQANRLGSIGTITTSVAHEINQPVAAIRTAAENGVKLLARGDMARTGANLDLIVSLTQRIGAITGELLSYARRGRPGREPVPVDAVLDGTLMLIGDSFRRAGVTLTVVRAPDLPTLSASRIRLEQVLVNILGNALDAVSGRPGALVRLEAAVEGADVRLSIHDNGPGLPSDLGEAVFQPFVTGKPHGTGLGLGISREIVADHGGTLTARPSPLGGAVFHVLLPITPSEPR